MKHFVLLMLMCVSVLGCTGSGKRYLTEDESMRMKHASVTLVVKKSPAFQVLTPTASFVQSSLGGACSGVRWLANCSPHRIHA